jgi:hypothetical protein
MCKKILPLLISVVSLVAVTTRANDIEPSKEFYTAIRANPTNPIVVDGVLNEWVGVPVLSDPRFYIRTPLTQFEGTAAGKGSGGTNAQLVLFERYQGGDWTGPDDHTSAVQIVYDADNVYFGFVVTDEYHENAANSNWNGDSVQLMIANSDRTVQVALYNYALGGVEGATTVEPEGDRHEAGPAADPNCNCPTEVRVTRNAETHKTTYEIRLPVASVGLTSLTAGTTFGLGMAINDGDQLTPGQRGWGGLGAHSIVFGKTPSETALVTLSTNLPTEDRIFFSAINTTIDFFTFRANDKGASIIDVPTARVTIDGQTFTPTASPKVGDAVDFTYTPSSPFPSGNHTYVISVRDTVGNTVTVSNNWVTPPYAFLTAADRLSAPTDPGFLWSIHQNPSFTEATLSRALHQLAGLLGDNYADPSAGGTVGPTTAHPVAFELPEMLNLDQAAGSSGDIVPDQQMPGIPGFILGGETDGIAAEVTTFIDLPAGRHTLIINSEDGFRTTAGNINDIFQAQLVGEFEGTRSPAADTEYEVRVRDAGVYAFRTVYYAGAAGASIEWKMKMDDSSEVLLNDINAGGPPTYRRASSLKTGIKMASPLPGSTGVAVDTPIFISIIEGTNLVTGSVQLVFNNAAVTPTTTRLGNLIEVRYQPPSALLPGRQYPVILRYTAGGVQRQQNWSFTTAAPPPFSLAIERSGDQINVTWTEPGTVLQESTDFTNWNDLTGATSPYGVTTTGRSMVFYRLRK